MFFDRTLGLHAVLAVSGVVAAYTAFSAPPQENEEGLELVATRPELLQKATWKDETNTVELIKSGTDWNVSIAKKDAAAKTYPATARITDVVKQLAPLRAVRELGGADTEKRASFGLEKPLASLTLAYDGKSETLTIGNATYGNSGYYVQSSAGGLYLVKAAVFNDLKNGAQALAEKVLLPIKREDVTRVVVAAKGGGRELVQGARADRAKAFYADVSAPETKLNQSTNWVDRLLRLRIIDVGVALPSEAPELEATFSGERGELGVLKIWAVGEKEAVAWSSRFGGAVTLSKGNAEGVLKDLSAVLEEK